MKQHITKEQWSELTRMQQRSFEVFMLESDDLGNEFDEFYGTVDIGCMIEFLGDDIERQGGLFKNTTIEGKLGWQEPIINGGQLELCDALWEAVKCKLNE